MTTMARLAAVLLCILASNVPAAGADEAHDRAGAFVTQVYRQLLGRPGAPDEIAAWAGAITSGALTPEQVRDAIAGSPEARARVADGQCAPTPGAPPASDVARGRCLFHSARAFGQDPGGPFPSCASCHYGEAKTDHAVHLVQVTNAAGATAHVLRRTPSLLRARVNTPLGWDGRFASVQDAARAAVLSPAEMNGQGVSPDQLDALAAFVLALPSSEPPASPTVAEPGQAVLQNIATGRAVFFGRGGCVGCHPAPTFTINRIAVNQVGVDLTGPTDPGAAFVGTGPALGFKVPSLLFLDAERPFMHGGSLGTLGQVVRFYDTSLGLGLSGAELVGLEYWLRSCVNPLRAPLPTTC
jgi:cytochrome c peroxidase